MVNFMCFTRQGKSYFFDLEKQAMNSTNASTSFFGTNSLNLKS